MRIRPARAADADRLSAVSSASYTQAFGHSFEPGDLRDHLERFHSARAFADVLGRNRVLVAELDEGLVGYVEFLFCGAVAEAPQECWEIRRLYVDPAFQRRGIGTALLNAALADPDLARAPCIVLDVWEKNAGAERLYRRYGFKRVGFREFGVPSGAATTRNVLMLLERDIAEPRHEENLSAL